MTRAALIEQTLNAIRKLPADKLQQASDFIAFLLKGYEEDQLSEGVAKIAEEGGSFEFLEQEEDLYTVSDLKEVYHAKR